MHISKQSTTTHPNEFVSTLERPRSLRNNSCKSANGEQQLTLTSSSLLWKGHAVYESTHAYQQTEHSSSPGRVRLYSEKATQSTNQLMHFNKQSTAAHPAEFVSTLERPRSLRINSCKSANGAHQLTLTSSSLL